MHLDNALVLDFSVTSANIAISDISLKTRFFGLHFRRRKSWCIFNHFYVISLDRYRIRRKKGKVTAITPFKVIQGHRFWYQSKARMRLIVTYILSCTVSKLWQIIGQFSRPDRRTDTIMAYTAVGIACYSDGCKNCDAMSYE